MMTMIMYIQGNDALLIKMSEIVGKKGRSWNGNIKYLPQYHRQLLHNPNKVRVLSSRWQQHSKQNRFSASFQARH